MNTSKSARLSRVAGYDLPVEPRVRASKEARTAAKELAVSYHQYRMHRDELDLRYWSSKESVTAVLVWAKFLQSDQRRMGVELVADHVLTSTVAELRAVKEAMEDETTEAPKD